MIRMDDQPTKTSSVDEALDWILSELDSGRVTVYRQTDTDLPAPLQTALINVAEVHDARFIRVVWDQAEQDARVATAYLDPRTKNWEPGWVA